MSENRETVRAGVGMLRAMDLDEDALYRALRARDARFDGRVFVCVRTTGIYCRPVCPARTPRRENVTFCRSAAEAQEAGFRPCLRCRPETSPELGAWHGTSNTVARALALIDAGALDADSVEALAERVGVGGRQLRRLFQEHLGATPVAVAQARRVHLAKQLVRETDLGLSEIALASGFGSVRRFNEAFRLVFGKSPSKARDAAATARRPTGTRHRLSLGLAGAAPYAWDELLAFLGARAVPGVELVQDGAYTRAIPSDGEPGLVSVSARAGGRLAVTVTLPSLTHLPGVLGRVRRVLDLAAEPLAIDAHLAQDPWLSPLVERRPGLRVPGAWDGFELAVRAILGQQIGVGAAQKLLGRLVTLAGERLPPAFPSVGRITHLFPTPERVVSAELGSLGVPRSRSRALVALARAVMDDPRLLSAGMELPEAVRRLRQIPGVGEWTAEYIAMLELREPDAFPAGDAALVRAASRIAGRAVTPGELRKRAERWRPFRAYAAVHLWAPLAEPTTHRQPLGHEHTDALHVA